MTTYTADEASLVSTTTSSSATPTRHSATDGDLTPSNEMLTPTNVDASNTELVPEDSILKAGADTVRSDSHAPTNTSTDNHITKDATEATHIETTE